MPRTRPITRPPGGATPWLLATLLGLVGWAHESTPLAQPMQHWLQDRAVADARPMASTGVAMVLIDEASQARHGPLPWRRDLHARLIDQLSGARVVIDTEPFGTPESERALAELLPEVPFAWVEFKVGQMGIFVVERSDLVQHHARIKALADARRA